MDTLFDVLSGALWPLLLVGGALAVAGLAARSQGRRRVDALLRVLAARRCVRQIAPGLAYIRGRWRRLDERRGLLEDDSGAALVLFADGYTGAPAADLGDGGEVIVVALGGGLVDDPRDAGYRDDARLPQLSVVDAGHFVRPAARSLDRDIVRANAVVVLAGAAFAVGLGLAAAAVFASLR